MDSMFSLKEPKTGRRHDVLDVDVHNPRTGDDFVLGLKEIALPDGTTRPYSMWLSGEYPRALDGLCKLLSLDMRVIDPAWIGMKLKKLLDFPEPLGDFMAFVPGSKSSRPGPPPWPTWRGWCCTATRCSASSTRTACRCSAWASSRRRPTLVRR